MNVVSYHRYAVAEPKIHVDIIEDHAVLLECLVAWMAMKAPDIVVVGRYGCWAEAVVDLDDLSDVVVLDILLGDNVPLRNKIRTLRSAGVNVVVLSAVEEPAVVRQALAAGALAYVCKTEAVHNLVSAIRAAARGEQHTVPKFPPALRPFHIQLTTRELEAATIYFTGVGRTVAEVGAMMGITVHTAKKLLKAVHLKARMADEPLNRLGVRQRLIDEGLLVVEAGETKESRKHGCPPAPGEAAGPSPPSSPDLRHTGAPDARIRPAA